MEDGLSEREKGLPSANVRLKQVWLVSGVKEEKGTFGNISP